MSIIEGIAAAAKALAQENVRPVRHQIVLAEYDAISGNGEFCIIQTGYGAVEVVRERRALLNDDAVVTLPIGEMRAAMRELEENARDWSSANDVHAAKVSMGTIRRCVALLRAAESMHILGKPAKGLMPHEEEIMRRKFYKP